MRDTEKRQDDEDPGPLKHSDAERLTSDGDTSDSAEDMENDPSRNPPDRELGDVKGG